MRRWSVRHARALERLYDLFEPALAAAHPWLRRIGYARMEKPVAAVERVVKGFLFDCRMCGQCVLSSTGMACPMNCPKHLRNGPCGGVRANGNCEVEPAMRCVWVEATEGAARMRDGEARLRVVQAPVDSTRVGTSSWLHTAREVGERRAPAAAADAGVG